MQQVAPRINDEMANELLKFAETKNAGAVEAIDGYVYIRRATWYELKGMFTKNEATALVDMYNGVMLTAQLQYQQSVLCAQIEDAEKYDGTCTNHGANVSELLEKANKLTASQVWVLQQELTRAWNNNVKDKHVIESVIKHLSEN